jgi:hypothetical protein
MMAVMGIWTVFPFRALTQLRRFKRPTVVHVYWFFFSQSLPQV